MTLDYNALGGKRVLVCGGAGFMGSNFILYTLARIPDLRIVNLDLLTYAGNPENLAGVDTSRYSFVKGDIADADLTAKLFKDADMVVNFAAETHVDRSIHSSAEAFVHTNVLGVHFLLEALRHTPNVGRMVYISTDEVWGDIPLDSKERFTEESPFLPNSPYAASKAAGDLLVRAYVKTHQLPVIVTHSVNNYGPRQFPEKIIPFFTARALQDEPLPLYGDGENRRDWLYVDDHSEAILTVLTKGTLGEVYNISQQKEYSNKELALRILEALGKPASLITYVEDRPAHDRKYAVDSAKLRGLGWTPKYTLEEKLSEVVRDLAASLSLRAAPATNTHISL
ncbi:dTDP-glucose 4,6-dehydratase [Candidatus Kaiserbacteria bacterium]|nr:dTDP-glucose 4,6-dehydratase [Candidatus Kaiserbacteria bacterium]